MKYPVYIPSKGRYQTERALTARALQRDGVPFYLVVEPGEAEAYRTYADHLLVLPESGQGLIYSRNWIRDHAEAAGHQRHWQLDDNISMFYRSWDGFRVPVCGAAALRVCEELTDRFENVGISGLNYDMFVTSSTASPFFRNVHVYSCTLINHALPARWRLVYNDDTDICLQALSTGWATILVNAFTAKKTTTMMISGGNTDDLYRQSEDGDARDTLGRFEMARALERAWPGVVRVARKFGRYQHSVNWKAFDVPLQLCAGVNLEKLPDVDERGLTLRAIRTVKSPRIQRLLEAYPERIRTVPAADPLWRGLPAFRTPTQPLKLRVRCLSTDARDQLVSDLGVLVDKKFANKGWSAWWPPRGREDPASLRFDYEEEPEMTEDATTTDGTALLTVEGQEPGVEYPDLVAALQAFYALDDAARGLAWVTEWQAGRWHTRVARGLYAPGSEPVEVALSEGEQDGVVAESRSDGESAQKPDEGDSRTPELTASPSESAVAWLGADRLRDRLVPIDSLPVFDDPAEIDLERLASALRETGQVRPVLVDATGAIVGRYHLVQAAVELGWTHIATRLQTGEDLAAADADQMSLVDEVESTGKFEAADLAALASSERLDGQVSEAGVDAINEASAEAATEWVGLPEFVPVDSSWRLVVSCESEATRDALLDLMGIATIHKGTRGTLSVWWPERAKYDLASLRFEATAV